MEYYDSVLGSRLEAEQEFSIGNKNEASCSTSNRNKKFVRERALLSFLQSEFPAGRNDNDNETDAGTDVSNDTDGRFWHLRVRTDSPLQSNDFDCGLIVFGIILHLLASSEIPSDLGNPNVVSDFRGFLLNILHRYIGVDLARGNVQWGVDPDPR